MDGDGRLAFLNPAAAEILDLSSAEWMGAPDPGAGSTRSPRAWACVIERSSREGHAGAALRDRAARRTPPSSWASAPPSWSAPATPGPAVTAIFQDITEKMRVEALRRRAERLEAVAELSASLAHEIKNPLASIRSAVEQISTGQVDEDDAQLLKRLVVRESDRLSRLLDGVHRLRTGEGDRPRAGGLRRAGARRARAGARAPRRAAPGAAPALRVAPGPPGCAGRATCCTAPCSTWCSTAPSGRARAGVVALSLDEVRSDLLSPALGALSLIRLTVARQRTRAFRRRSSTASSTPSSPAGPAAPAWASPWCSAPWRLTAAPSSSTTRPRTRAAAPPSPSTCPRFAGRGCPAPRHRSRGRRLPREHIRQGPGRRRRDAPSSTPCASS